MRPTTIVLVLALLAAVTGPVLFGAELPPFQDRAWARFTHTVKVDDKLLPEGTYLFVHDDVLKAAGEPCLYLYREGDLEQPVVAVHCIRMMRTPADETQVVLARMSQSGEVREFQYVQFAGDAFAHHLH